MRRIQYPDDIEALKDDYKRIFAQDYQNMQTRWVPLRNELRQYNGVPEDSVRLYPNDVLDIIVADYDFLVNVFVNYHHLKKLDAFRNELHDELFELFNYSGDVTSNIPKFQPMIADFFMRHQKDLKIDVCYYCELSYINSYGFSDTFRDIGKFLMRATRHQIEMQVRRADGKKYATKTYDKITELQKQADVTKDNIVDRFNDIFRRWNSNNNKSDDVERRMRNHFDLDHFLPKSECPLVGLSLMNFVPCCSVCNEKLKGQDILGGEIESDWERVLKKVSPISQNYNLDSVSKLKLLDNGHGWLRAQDHPDDFSLVFSSTDNDYQTEIIDEFHLEERYAYHKCEALRWYDLKHDYPDSKINEMAKALNEYKTADQLRNDIFQIDYFENNVRCFDKLRRDILGI